MRSLCKPLSVNRSESRRSLSLRQPNRSAIVVFLILLFAAATAFADDEARRLVALLDYLGSDYKNAVQDGKIVNPNEFAEMQEFSKRTLELFKQLKETDKADKAGIEPSLKSLASQIENKADPKAVAELANGAKQKLHRHLQYRPLSQTASLSGERQSNLFRKLRPVSRRDWQR